MIKLFYLMIFLSLSFVYCKNSLHMFQQNRYEIYRYSKWLFNKKNIHFSYAIIYCVLMLLIMLIFNGFFEIFLTVVLTLAFAVYNIYAEIKKEYIKDLVLTFRVYRQIAVLFILLAGIILVYLNVFDGGLGILGIAVIYLPYLLIYPVDFITHPIEEAIKKMYENKARKILGDMNNLIKIGITGSFGKTTTKNVVNEIIGESYYSLMTPASYNTPMGITRTVREYLKPVHEVFVCEMGADKVGEISYLMDFVKPEFGIVTSIGPQHLNTFHSMENIINEKMQMIEMLPENGTGIINLDNEYIRDYKIKNSCRIVSVAIDNQDADLVARNIEYNSEGSRFTVEIDGADYEFKTVLLGKHNIMNLLSGIAVALELNIKPEVIAESVRKVHQVEHRLELKKINGFTFIDNAFNSNPVSSKLSLDVLEMMKNNRIIVTPGLIDLGEYEDKYNYEFGEYMINKTDYVLLVGEKQTAKVYEGLKDSGFDMNNVLVFRNVKEAFNHIYTHFSTDDTILLENDLPDAFSI